MHHLAHREDSQGQAQKQPAPAENKEAMSSPLATANKLRLDQMLLDLDHTPSYSQADWLTTPCNRQALEALQLWRDWPSHHALLIGDQASGKTHLAHIWAEQSQAIFLYPDDGQDQVASLYEKMPAVVLDDIHHWAHQSDRLFHILNTLRLHHTPLLITSRLEPDQCGFTRQDVVSRLRDGLRLTLDPPDEILLLGLFSKLFADRQMAFKEDIISYLVKRMERSHACAQRLVTLLDMMAVGKKRSLTRVMAQEALAQLGLDQT
jgi:chromosomal replication initiation ATPase DnaA